MRMFQTLLYYLIALVLIYALVDIKLDLHRLLQLHYAACPYMVGCDEDYE